MRGIGPDVVYVAFKFSIVVLTFPAARHIIGVVVCVTGVSVGGCVFVHPALAGLIFLILLLWTVGGIAHGFIWIRLFARDVFGRRPLPGGFLFHNSGF